MSEPYCPFVVGQLVVCVDAAARPGREWLGRGPSAGTVYTVARVGIHDCGDALIALVELPRHKLSIEIGNWGYRASRFRPVPSISALTELLNTAPVDEVVG